MCLYNGGFEVIKPLSPTDGQLLEPNVVKGKFLLFNNLGTFENAVEAEAHIDFDFDRVIELSSESTVRSQHGVNFFRSLQSLK
jgi:hypothetical protein